MGQVSPIVRSPSHICPVSTLAGDICARSLSNLQSMHLIFLRSLTSTMSLRPTFSDSLRSLRAFPEKKTIFFRGENVAYQRVSVKYRYYEF